MGYRKRMGQNFLRDANIARKQVCLAEIDADERVLEIGGGHGILTKMLVETGAHVVCIEKDSYLAEELRVTVPEADILEGDALTVEWPPFHKLVANIPYSISTDLTLKILEHDFDMAVVMFQEEFARRLAAGSGSGDYSRLGIRASYRHEVDIAFRVSRNAFYPPPRVDSAVVVIEPVEPLVDVVDEELFFLIVEVLFSHRRKKARNNLMSGILRISGASGADQKKLEDIIRSWKLGEDRIESISMEDIADLANSVSDIEG